MPAKITNKEKEFLLSVSLPEKTHSYTPISHEFAIGHIEDNLLNKNLLIKNESFRATANGNIANGIFELNHKDEANLQMICCFSNSYDKSTRFSVAIGAKVIETGNYFLSDISWIRKHSGKADKEAEEVIKDQISHAEDYFKKLIEMKSMMENVTCTKERFGSMIGQLFVNELLSVDQVSECFKQWKKMEVDEDVDVCNLWKAYNYVLTALMSSHPSKWISNQIYTNLYVSNMFKIKSYKTEEQMEFDFEQVDEIAVPKEKESKIIYDEDFKEETEETKETKETEEISIEVEYCDNNQSTDEKEESPSYDFIEKTEEDEKEIEDIDNDTQEEIETYSEEASENVEENTIEEVIEESYEEDGISTQILDYEVCDKISNILDELGINEGFVAYDNGDKILVTTESQSIEINKSDVYGNKED